MGKRRADHRVTQAWCETCGEHPPQPDQVQPEAIRMWAYRHGLSHPDHTAIVANTDYRTYGKPRDWSRVTRDLILGSSAMTVEQIMDVLDEHRWKTMGVSSVECECGAILHGDDSLTGFPADEAFRRHVAEAIVARSASPGG